MAFQPGANLYPLAFGNRPENLEVPHIDTRNPATTDVNYPIGKIWLNASTASFFGLGSQSSAGGVLASNWVGFGGGSSALVTLTGNSGSPNPVTPIAGNINILGNNQATFVASAGTLTLTQTPAGFPVTPFVVGPAGSAGYQTIQAAVTAAGTTAAAIYIQPGTYTENITFVAGSNLMLVGGGYLDTIITGVHVPPTSGTLIMRDLQLTSATNIFNSAAAGTATLTFDSCVVNCTNGFSYNLANWTGTLQSFHSVHGGTANGFVTNSAGSPLFVSDSTIGNGTGQTMVTSGAISLEHSQISCPWSPTTGTVITAIADNFTATVTLGGNTTGTFDNCSWSTGAVAAITMSSSAAISISNSTITSSNNPAIAGAGAGVLTLGGVDFTNNTSTAGTLTLGTADVFKAGAFQSLSTITAATSITATAGNITATNGNLVLNTAGNKIVSTSVGTTTAAGANSFGSVTLVGGTATVATTSVTASSLIITWRQSVGASTALGILTVGTITAGTSFVISAATQGTPGTPLAADVSVVGWMIIN